MKHWLRGLAVLVMLAPMVILLPEQATATPAGSAATQALRQAGDPIATGPSGDLIAYVCHQDSRSAICTIRPDGSEHKVLTGPELGSVFSPTWSPDGQRIAYSRGGMTIGANNEIWVMDADGSNQRRVGPGSLPSWSPVTTDAVFEFDATSSSGPQGINSYRWKFGEEGTARGSRQSHSFESTGRSIVELSVVGTDGTTSTATRMVDVDRPYDRAPEPVLKVSFPAERTVHVDASESSDGGGRIAQFEYDFSGDAEGYVTGGDSVTHTFPPTGEHEISVRITDDQGLTSTIVRSAALSQATPIVTEADFQTSITGGRIAALRGPDSIEPRITELVTMNVDGTDVRSHGLGSGIQEDPAWTPDGKRLLYTSRSTHFSEWTQSDVLSVADAFDGVPYQNLTNTRGRDNNVSEINPAMSPDGTRMAYVECVPFGTQGKCTFDTTRIAVADVAPDGLTRQTPLIPPKDAFQLEPAWSPGGTQLAYADLTRITADPGELGGLWLMAPDGRGRARIPNTHPLDRSPDWRPFLSAASVREIQLRSKGHLRSVLTVGDDLSVVIKDDLRGEASRACIRRIGSDGCLPGSVAPVPQSAGTPLSLPVELLGPGRYEVIVFDGAESDPIAKRPFTVVCNGRCDGALPLTAAKSSSARFANGMAQSCPALVATAGSLAIASIATRIGFSSPASSLAGLGYEFGYGLTAVNPVDSLASLVGDSLTDTLDGYGDGVPPLVVKYQDLTKADSDASGPTIGGLPRYRATTADLLMINVAVICTKGIRVAQEIAADPPDADFAVVEEPDLTGTDQQGLGVAEEIRRSWTASSAYGVAVLAALEKFQGADLAGDAEAATRQLDALSKYMDGYGRELLGVADAFGAFREDLTPGPLDDDIPFTASELDALRARQLEVAADGFNPETRARYAAAGLGDAEIDSLRQNFVDTDLTDSLATDSFLSQLQRAEDVSRQAGDEAQRISEEVRIFRFGYSPVPLLSEISVEVPRNTPTSVALEAIDPENAGMTYRVVEQPRHGQLSGTAPNLVYTPSVGYLGADSFTWTASNDDGAAPPATVSIDVLLPAPEAVADSYGTNLSTPLQVPAPGVLTNDLAMAIPMTAEIEQRPTKGSVALQPDGSFTYTPRPSATGVDRFTYRARTPGSAASEPTTVTIALTAANRPPTVVADLLEIDEDSAGSVDVLANDSDLDGDPLTVTGVRQPRYGAIVCVLSVCTYSPPPNFNGTDSFTYAVSDGQGTTSTGVVRVAVRPVDDPPDAVNDLASIEPGLPATVDVMANDSDPDGDEITFVGHGVPTRGSVDCTPAGVCTYTPDDSTVSADSFVYTIRDSQGNESQGVVEIVNEPPMISSAGPLDLIITGNTLSCSVNYTGDAVGSFYNDVGCGTFLATGGSLYGQSFTGVGLNPPQPRDTYEPLSQSRVMGAGTVDDPYRVITRVRAGDSGLELTQTDSYVVGEESYRTDIAVENTGVDAAPAVLFRGGDCQLGDSDTGFGRIDSVSGAVACTDADGRILEWVPLTEGSTAIETDSEALWDAIASQQPFPDTCRCAEDIDSAGGLSWAFTVAAGGVVTQSHRTVFSPFGYRPLSVNMATSTPTVGPLGAAAYEMTITNPNTTSPAVLETITARLPLGFLYEPGSTSGAATVDPTIVGRTLTWTGPFTVPADGSITVRFGAEASDRPGTYLTSATATAKKFAAQSSGDTAPIEVVDTIAPIASFEAEGDALTLGFDGSGSFDLDGTVESYSWYFGDGSTGTGVSPDHTYPAAGTFQVTLTVTDDDGATGSVSKPVIARDPNLAPVAIVDQAVDELEVHLDGSGSTDADGTVVTYTWDLGDGTSAWGAAPSHTYAAPGTYTVTLTVTDDRGTTDTETASVTVAEAENQPPIASFTSSPNGLTVGYDGGASIDPDEPGGKVATYTWEFGDGGTGAGERPEHTYPAAGTYPVTVTVTDRRGATASVTRSILVAEDRIGNAPPEAVIVTQIDGLDVAVDGASSSDPDGQIVAYEWEFATFGYDEGAVRSLSFPEPGTYPVRLVVTDDDGASAATVVHITVPGKSEPPENRPPTAAFTSTTNGLKANFDSAGSTDPDGTIASFAWDFGDGSSGTAATPSHTYAAAGTYQVTLTVTDDDGATNSITHGVVVTAVVVPNKPPVAVLAATPDGLAVAVDGGGSSDPDGSIEAYAWDFGDGASGSGVSAGHTYAAGGTYVVTLTVTDDDGAKGTATRQVTVVAPNQLPVAAFAATPAGLAVAVDGAGSSDPDGSIVGYAWDFGDGASGSGVSAGHTYAAAGTYTVTLTVTDNDGAKGTATRQVTVTAPNDVHPPVAAFTAGTDGLGASFDASSSSDPDGTIITYSWKFGDGGSAVGITPTHRYSTAGTYDVTLTVTDDDGQTDTVTVPVTVWAAGEAPGVGPVADFNFEPDALRVRFDGTSSIDPDGTVVSYRWDLGDGSTSNDPTPSHTYAKAGDYLVHLTVIDDDGRSDDLTRTVNVSAPNGPTEPVAIFTVMVDGATVTFDGSGSYDTDSRIVSWSWAFGDESGGGPSVVGTGEVVGHLYPRPGTFDVLLTVRSADGGSATTTQQVTVERVSLPKSGVVSAGGGNEPNAASPSPSDGGGKTHVSLPVTGSKPLPLLRIAFLLICLGLLAELWERRFKLRRR